ncbi:MAG: GntR family transcriptional regulator [Cellvibrionaceae bacterium]
MAEIGKFNTLTVIKETDFGVYLDGGVQGEILLPLRYVPDDCQVGDSVDVFIYTDTDDLLVATTEEPLATVGECALLQVSAVNQVGAFLNWGLGKDLLVPFSQQRVPLEEERFYVVYVYLDPITDRVAASTKLHKFLSEDATYLKPRQAVDLMIWSRTRLGYKAVINGTHLGVIHNEDVDQAIAPGDKLQGWVKAVRRDQKVDLTLSEPPTARAQRDELSQCILDHLKSQGGMSTLTDKSTPEAIKRVFNVSKGAYKKALGGLYKQKLISLEKDSIRLR